jgi:hypothetical protein
VRDHDRRAPLREPVQLVLDRALGARVERRRCFVEHDDARNLEDRARNRDPLALAAGEPHAGRQPTWR